MLATKPCWRARCTLSGLINRAGDPECRQIEARLNQVITGGYFDLDKIKSEVWGRLALTSVVNDAMKRIGTAWDYVADPRMGPQYVRK